MHTERAGGGFAVSGFWFDRLTNQRFQRVSEGFKSWKYRKSYTEADLRDMDELMHQLSATSYCDEKILQAIMDDVNSHLYGAVANDNVNVITLTMSLTITSVSWVVRAYVWRIHLSLH